MIFIPTLPPPQRKDKRIHLLLKMKPSMGDIYCEYIWKQWCAEEYISRIVTELEFSFTFSLLTPWFWMNKTINYLNKGIDFFFFHFQLQIWRFLSETPYINSHHIRKELIAADCSYDSLALARCRALRSGTVLLVCLCTASTMSSDQCLMFLDLLSHKEQHIFIKHSTPQCNRWYYKWQKMKLNCQNK